MLTTVQLHPWRHPASFDFHYSKLWHASLTQQLTSGRLESGPRTDPDLAAHLTTLRARGRVVRGAPIQEVFPQVPEADFCHAVLADLEWIGQHRAQVYGVLNACRVLAWLGGRGVLSKAEAADWALGSLPAATGRPSARPVSPIARAATSPARQGRCERSSGGRRHTRPGSHRSDEALIPARTAHPSSPRPTSHAAEARRPGTNPMPKTL